MQSQYRWSLSQRTVSFALAFVHLWTQIHTVLSFLGFSKNYPTFVWYHRPRKAVKQECSKSKSIYLSRSILYLWLALSSTYSEKQVWSFEKTAFSMAPRLVGAQESVESKEELREEMLHLNLSHLFPWKPSIWWNSLAPKTSRLRAVVWLHTNLL